MSQNPFWKDALMNKCFLKNQWMNFFLSKSKNSKNESIDFINKINEALQSTIKSFRKKLIYLNFYRSYFTFSFDGQRKLWKVL